MGVTLSSDDKTFYVIDQPRLRAGTNFMSSITAMTSVAGGQTQIVLLPRVGSAEGVILSSDQKTLYLAGCDENCREKETE